LMFILFFISTSFHHNDLIFIYLIFQKDFIR
jgi:hypothetical protein